LVEGAFLAGKEQGCLRIGFLEGATDFVFYSLLLDNQEVPRLHKAYGWRVVGCGQDLGQDFIGDGIGQELAADIAPGKNGSVNCGTFVTGERRCGRESVGWSWHRGSPSDALWRGAFLHEGTTFPAWPVF
jgi:hypothetical protein